MADEPKLPEKINFDYIKTNQFRVVHADGAFFALTPAGGLTISFFTERQPIPRRVVHRVKPDGSLGEEILEERVTRDAMIRDAEVVVTMSMQTAQQIKERLDGILNKAAELSLAQQSGKQP